MKFWNKDVENDFFTKSLSHSLAPEKLFYLLNKSYFAYIPKNRKTSGKTLQSRNSLIGQYTETWCRDFFQPIANSLNLHAVNGVVCKELGLTNQSSADLAFCTTKKVLQKPEQIKLIFEIKMSIVNNYSYNPVKKKITYMGDYKSHRGTPSILRSDSVLKAIGKSINFRVSGPASTKIPIIVLGNTPITTGYKEKIDLLKQFGVIQGFLSLYPSLHLDNSHVKETPKKGFQTFDRYSALDNFIQMVVSSNLSFFCAMQPKDILGKIISTAAMEKTDLTRAEQFLNLLKEK